jgi:hypothetical protein
MAICVCSCLTGSTLLRSFPGDIVNGSKVLVEIILNSNKSWKVLIRGKTVNPGKIGLDELYNLDSVFEIVRQMKYCRAVLHKKWHLRGIQMDVGGTETLSACV